MIQNAIAAIIVLFCAAYIAKKYIFKSKKKGKKGACGSCDKCG